MINNEADKNLLFQYIDYDLFNQLDNKDKFNYLVNIINYNQHIHQAMLHELTVINNIKSNSLITLGNSELTQKRSQKEECIDNTQCIDKNIKKYIDIFDSISLDDYDEEDLYDMIVETLPPKNMKNFRKIFNKILLELERIKKDYTGMVASSFSDEQELWRQEYLKIALIQKEIIEYRDKNIENIDVKNENITVSGEKSNEVYFLKDSRGNIFFQKDLESISQEYYESFNRLLQSILDGSYIYKNYHYFNSNHKKVAGDIITVKGFKTRIIFERVSLYQFVILGAFIKKTNQNTRSIQATIKMKKRGSSLSINQILEQYNSDDLDTIKLLLTQGKKVKSYEYH